MIVSVVGRLGSRTSCCTGHGRLSRFVGLIGGVCRGWYRGRAGERVVRPLGKIQEPQMWLSGSWKLNGGDQTIGVAKVAWQCQAAVWLVSQAAH